MLKSKRFSFITVVIFLGISISLTYQSLGVNTTIKSTIGDLAGDADNNSDNENDFSFDLFY